MKNFKNDLVNEINLYKNTINQNHYTSQFISKIFDKKIPIDTYLNIRRNFINYLFPNRFYLSLAAKFGIGRSIYYSLQDDMSKKILIQLLVSKILGKKYENISEDNENISKINSCALNHSALTVKGENVPLFNLSSLGYSIMLNSTAERVSEFDYYKLHNMMKIKKDDIFIDMSGGFGESTLLFSSMLQDGNVLTYHSEKSNLAVLKHNINLNPHLSRNIQLKMSMDFNELDRVDVIKIDFCFFDLVFLKTLVNLIRRFHPKLIMKFHSSSYDVISVLSLLNKITKEYIFCLSQNKKGEIYLLSNKIKKK